MTLATPLPRITPDVRLTYDDYARFGQWLLDRCGLYFPDKRWPELEQGVRQAFAASTCANLDEYYQLLQASGDGTLEVDRLINAVTVSETHFFRDAAQFGALQTHVLPHIIERRRPLRTLRVWSAGCASGEEPYSIAMLLRELLPDVDEWAITILGTDINTGALDRARKAIYGEWAFREEGARQRRSRYFRPIHTGSSTRYELIPEVRRMVTFAKLNLAEPSYPSYQTNTTMMDLILCRNVTIYLSESVTLQVVERLYDALVDGGWLAVGHSEPSLTTYRRFQVCNWPDTILYQRTGPSNWSWPADVPQLASTGCDTLAPAPAPALPTEPGQPLSPAISPVPGQDPLEHAQELMEYGHSEQARDVLLKLIEPGPGRAPAAAEPVVLRLLGQVYANLGHWPEAERWCRQAIQSDKLALEAYYTLALVLQHQGRLDQAIDMMKKVVYIDRRWILGHFGLANLYRARGQLAQAQKSLENARRLLDTRPADELIPGSGGVTVGRLQEAVARQQQAWSMAESDRGGK